MGSNTIPAAVSNNVIPASHHNSIRSALAENHVPRNTAGVATNEGGSIGESAFRWLQGFFKTVFIGSVADNISIEADASDCIIKVGGVERARIPQSVNLLPSGMITPYSGAADIAGWLLCDGREVSRSTYANLFAVVGTIYGEGNTTTTFNIPDLRGRFLRGSDNMGTGAAGRDPNAGARTAMASGGATGATVGSVQLDAMETHHHVGPANTPVNSGTNGYGTYTKETKSIVEGAGASTTYGGLTSIPTTPDSVAEPRISTETRPTNANINFLIKV